MNIKGKYRPKGAAMGDNVLSAKGYNSELALK